MKTRAVLISGIIAGSLALPSTAGALECAISNTGPASNNTCTENIGKSCIVNNNNVIIITNSNNQQSGSGDANSSGNGTAGGATSGGASNTNTGTVSVGVDNTGACVVATTPETPTPTPTPEQPQVQSAQTTAPQQVKAPVGGVAAGVGSTDMTGALVGMLVAGVAAVGFGLRQLAFNRK